MLVDLSIVIVSYNTRDMLRDCLMALPTATEGLAIEVFVVDNASPDASAEMVRTEFPNVLLMANINNPGFARANNQALLASRGTNVVILNPDTVPERGSLTLLCRYLNDHPDVGAVGPMLLNTDGSLQRNGRTFPTPFREFLGHTGLRNLIRGSKGPGWEYGRSDFDVEADTDSVTGACMMLPRSVIDRVGMLDEEFFMFYEEVEWCWRIKHAGLRIVYVPQSRVVHHWMGSVRQHSRVMTIRLFESMLVYYRKTAGPGRRIASYVVYLAGFIKNELLYLGVAMKRLMRRARLIR
jgi:GT2 family glycosyltransferase